MRYVINNYILIRSLSSISHWKGSLHLSSHFYPTYCSSWTILPTAFTLSSLNVLQKSCVLKESNCKQMLSLVLCCSLRGSGTCGTWVVRHLTARSSMPQAPLSDEETLKLVFLFKIAAPRAFWAQLSGSAYMYVTLSCL